jgi:GntR family transcriptional regulator/MocR family aminotransferase
LTSRPLDLLVAVDRARPRTLGRQIEDQLRAAIRDNTLRQGTRLPSTRDLARELGVSRPIVVDAYAQLAGEGYLELRPGARPRVAGGRAAPREAPASTRPKPAAEPKYDFRPGVPDLSSFPRSAWLRSVREALSTMRDADLGYTDPHGTEVLRLALRDYLGRVRGVVADAGRVVITSGYCQGRSLVCRALVSLGAKRVAVEDPCHDEVRSSVVGAGLTLVPLPVDADGLRIEALEEVKADAVIVTPAHQYPTGAVLSGQRRGALLEWLRRRGTFALEDDYDAEYRYDRAPVGALQALDPERIVYAGTASKTLAPALRLGWLVVPPRLTAAVQQHQRQMDFGVSRIEQHAFADFLSRGELDRHLRRMRVRYRARRDALVEALTEALPEVRVHGIRAGLHLAVQLRDGDRARTIRTEALRRGVALTAMSDYYLERAPDSAMLLLGYGRISEAGIRAGVRELAAAVRSTRRLGG